MHAEGRIFYAGDRLWQSDDRGDHWRAISPDLTRNLDRRQMPILGKVQAEDAIGLHLYTTTMSVVTALDESPLQPGLLYTGSDDGVAHVSDNGGVSWRRIERFGASPEGAYITDLYASRHCSDVVFATVNDWQNGDFRPWVFKSTDRGQSWTDITGDLPERSGTWSIVQDPEAPDLLFVGAEFGVYVTLDGGAHWTLLAAGMPRIQARDLHLQPQWHDLVVGSFGRRAFVLDDISALRDVTAESLRADATLFRCRPAPLYEQRQEVAATWGDATAPNPPFGATLTYHVGPGLATGSQLVLIIRDEQGSKARVLNLDAEPGMHRITWDLCRAAADGSNARPGPRVAAGRFTAQLALEPATGDSNERRTIGPEQQILVTPLAR